MPGIDSERADRVLNKLLGPVAGPAEEPKKTPASSISRRLGQMLRSRRQKSETLRKGL